MKIAFIGSTGIPPNYGGAEKCIYEVSTRLFEWGHDVTVYGSKGFIKKKKGEIKGVKIINIPYFHVKWVDFPMRRFLSVLDSLGKDFDIIHLWGADSAVYALPYLLYNSKKTSISLIGPEWHQRSYPKIVRLLMKIFIDIPKKTCNSIVTDSIPIFKFYKKRFNLTPFYIPYGADCDINENSDPVIRSENLEPNRFLLYIGRLVPGKGIDILVKAFSQLDESIQENYPLIIIGGDPYSGKYLRQLMILAKGSNVKFFGSLYGSEIHKFYQKAAIFISPSYLEGTSPAILEAMGCGRCVIAADIPMNRATLGKSGVFFRVGDINSLSTKINDCLENPDKRKQKGILNSKRVKNEYSWDIVAKKYESMLYQTMMK